MTGLSFLKFISAMQGIKNTTKREQLIERLQFDATNSIRKCQRE